MPAIKSKLSKLRRNLVIVLLSFGFLQSCGDPITTAVVAQIIDAGVGGTGIVRGVITGFGSVYVNGIKFEVDEADFEVDGDTATNQSNLSKGMLITINGTINADGITGTATSLVYDDDIEGPISAVPSIVADSDGQQKSIEILGQNIIVDAISTHFKNTSFDTLSKDDVVEISGYRTSNTSITATLVKKTNDFVAGSTEIELKGIIQNLNPSTSSFDLLGIVIIYPVNIQLVLSDGLFVEVHGILEADGSISADEIEQEDGGFSESDGEISLSGLISDYVSPSNFKINNQLINANSAQDLEPNNALALLANGVKIEVEGSVTNNVLIATELEVKLFDIKLSAIVNSVGTTSIELVYPASTGFVTITVDNSTQFEDESVANLSQLSLAAINPTNYLEIKASLIAGEIIATTVKRDEFDEYILQGKVDSLIPNTSITVLNVTYLVDGSTEYDGYANASAVSINDLVRIKDEDDDGIADKVVLK